MVFFHIFVNFSVNNAWNLIKDIKLIYVASIYEWAQFEVDLNKLSGEFKLWLSSCGWFKI